jgi:putative ABC transport system permease protein
MFLNYVTTALRNLERNRLYAAITILGLAVAFAVAILIGQFARNEFTYDHWIAGHRQIYRITTQVQPPGQKPIALESTPGLAAGLRGASPGVAAVARLLESSPTVRRGGTNNGDTEWLFAWAEPDLFRVLPLPALAGDPVSALKQPDTVVITRRMARKYFHRDLPIGDVLEVRQPPDARWHVMRVAAVLKDLPANTNLKDEIFASGRSAYSRLNAIDAHPQPGAMMMGLLTFARLDPRVSAADFQRAVDAAGRPDAEAFRRAGDRISIQPVRLDDVHWMPRSGPGNPGDKPSGSKSITYAISAVAGLIVLVAAINFVTLMTARASRRGVEVGVRKATGATRRDLVVQFMGEALVQVALGALIGAGLAELLVGPFDALVQRPLAIDFLHDPLLLVGLAGFALVVGVLSAIYPALVLASFRPHAVLKGGTIRVSGSPLARASLVTVQFAVLMGLMLAATTIYRQTEFALAQGFGGSQSQRIVGVFGACRTAFPQEARRLPGVSAAACSMEYAMNFGQLVQSVQNGRGQRMGFDAAPVDFGFFELYGVRPLAGRLFSRGHGEDAVLADPKAQAQPTVVLNETAARALGYADPKAAIGRSLTWTRTLLQADAPVTGPSQIVGVIPDMPATVRAAVDPTVYMVLPGANTPNYADFLSIKLSGQDIPGTIRALQALWRRTGDGSPLETFSLAQFRSNLYVDLTIQKQAIAICAGLAILLSCLGLFALSAFMTERRTKEIGIRKALGAGQWDVVALLLWQFTVPVLSAVAVAAPAGLWAMHDWLSQFAYRVPLSPWTFVLAGAAAVAIAWATVSYQSLLVARAKPASALRYE